MARLGLAQVAKALVVGRLEVESSEAQRAPRRDFLPLNLALLASAAVQAYALHSGAGAGVDMNAPDGLWAALHWSVMIVGEPGPGCFHVLWCVHGLCSWRGAE